MKLKIHINRYLAILFMGLAMIATGCTDDELPDPSGISKPNDAVDYGDNYSLDFTVTLDEMGGSPTRADNFNPMKEMEDYIDPQKFRVLFFDAKGNFLFESKSRWVNKLDKEKDDIAHKRYYVSVPIFSYGNDTPEKWCWEKIREVMTDPDGGGFKIALLVNRPLNEYTSDYAGTNTVDGGTVKGWFPNNAPDWTVENSRFDKDGNENPKCKRIFDLHHSQMEPTYRNKGKPSGYSGEGFYNFLMEDAPAGVLDPPDAKMSPFVSWVNWDDENGGGTNKVKVFAQDCRKTLPPSKEHPIPMYGVQNFQPIAKSQWEKGTTFGLNRPGIDEPISLLRSAVKLELVLPANKKPTRVLLLYSNIYSRCEPMDVWTPTNQLWKEHDKGCEWEAIQKYGPIIRKKDPADAKYGQSDGTFAIYRKRISWIYGCWKKDGWWDFGTLGSANVVPEGDDTPYPRIFNPLIQRNNGVYVYGDQHTVTLYEDPEKKNIHIITYTGERNINDPSNLKNMETDGVGSKTVIFWVLEYDNKFYSLPIADYSKPGNTGLTSIGNGGKAAAFSDYNLANLSTYANNIADPATPAENRPWPLIRNHVYKMNIGNIARSGGGEDTLDDLNITSEVLYTPDISYGY
ncbi:MAG: hypothetical protein J1F16_05855 [Muribaculaceae bacterium]|nr:hypothetical protein [Muribaculaceae bacterium]